MAAADEREHIERLLNNLSDRVTDLQGAVRDQPQPLSIDEQTWVRLAIKKEAQSIRFREAVIEKTLTTLIIAGLLGLVGSIWVVLFEYIKNHGMWKP